MCMGMACGRTSVFTRPVTKLAVEGVGGGGRGGGSDGGGGGVGVGVIVGPSCPSCPYVCVSQFCLDDQYYVLNR